MLQMNLNAEKEVVSNQDEEDFISGSFLEDLEALDLDSVSCIGGNDVICGEDGVMEIQSCKLMEYDNPWDLGEESVCCSLFLSEADVAELMNEIVKNVTVDVVDLKNVDQARCLLKFLQWNEDRARQIRSDPDRSFVFQSAGLRSHSRASDSLSDGSSDDTCDEFDIVFKCEACGVTGYEKSLEIKLECGHGLCLDCSKDHVSTAITRMRDVSEEIRCPKPDCAIAIPRSLILKSVEKMRDLKEKFLDLEIESFIQLYPLIRRCPNSTCKMIVKVKGIGRQQIRCSCGMKYCFLCSKPWHSTIPCEALESWESNREIASIKTTRAQLEIEVIKQDICNMMKMSKEDMCWLKQNFQLVIRARKVLLSSLIFAEAFKDEEGRLGDGSKPRVEDLQENLETTTNELSLALTERVSGSQYNRGESDLINGTWEMHERLEIRLVELISFHNWNLAWKS